jgi:myo-inositol 2-dehydrogenase / D-chiro-inositol 1-dehydrogenase
MTDPGKNSSRRTFLKSSSALAVGGAVASQLGAVPAVHAAGSDVIKVGLVGCGGRGSGAAENCVVSSENVKIVAMGDVFRDRVDSCRNNLKKLGEKLELGDKLNVAEDRCFVGLDAYQQVIASDVDLVILATPPGFRPFHIEAVIAAGKNLFTEKPVSVDGAGIRRVLAAYEVAKKKNLAVVAGTQRRHEGSYLESMSRIHDGALGDITSARCYWNQGELWMKPRESSWSDVEWQIRNWLYFTWLSGDHICEQHVHNLDVMNWAIKAHPEKAVGLGGRQVRTDPAFGHIYDHFAIDYTYPGDVHVMSQCRQIPNCQNNVSEAVAGTKGSWSSHNQSITGQNNWRYRGKHRNPYEQEHTDLIASIRAGKPLNELKQVAESTLTAIMGRMSAYTGKEVTWEQALNSKANLVPERLTMDMSLPVPPVAMPGSTELV